MKQWPRIMREKQKHLTLIGCEISHYDKVP